MKFRFFIAAAILSITNLVTGCGKSEEQVRAEVAAEAASKAAIQAISFQSLEIALMTARKLPYQRTGVPHQQSRNVRLRHLT